MLQLLRNARVFSPTPLGVQDLVVSAGQIAWLGEGLRNVPPELVEEEIDLDGSRVIPGLIDCHVHITGGGGESGPESRVPPIPLSQFTSGGTTSVIGVLGTDDLTRSTASLVTATRALVEQGISAWCMTGGYHLPPMTLTGSVRGDIALVGRIISVGEVAISDHRSSQPTVDEILRIASDAHVAGLMTGKAGIVHLHMGDGKRGLELVRRCLQGSEIPARVFHPTHVNRKRALFEEALELVGLGCSIDVTAFPVDDENGDELSAHQAFLVYMKAGLPPGQLTVSSDAGGSLPVFDADGRVAEMAVGQPSSLADTLRSLIQAGHPLEQVLPAFTSNVAGLYRLPGKGRIAVGADADLVVLDDDDLITDVMARGKWHIRQGELRIKGTFE